MFRSIEEVIVRWQEKYEELTLSELYSISELFKIGSPGHSESEIESLEQALEIELHPDFKNFLRKARFDGTAFLTAGFYYGSSLKQIDFLRERNTGEGERFVDRLITDRKRYLEIGDTDGHIFVLDNEDGSIHVFLVDAPNITLDKVASDAEAFVCALASIDEIAVGKDVDEDGESQELKDFVETLVRETDQIFPNEFWYELATGVT